ncbi:MAG: hypothetical protein GX206_00720 [Clostridiales bacterium]|nr:hypothetical protein [Clostridiales bacterium]
MTCAYVRKNTKAERKNELKAQKAFLQVNNRFQRKLAKNSMKERHFKRASRGEKYIPNKFKKFIADGQEDKFEN